MVYTYLWKCYHTQDHEYIHYPLTLPQDSVIAQLSFRQLWISLLSQSSCHSLYFIELYANWIIPNIFNIARLLSLAWVICDSAVWLGGLRITRFIYFTCGIVSFICIYTTFSSYILLLTYMWIISARGYKNKDSVNICVKISVKYVLFFLSFLLGKYLWAEKLNHTVGVYLTF